MAVVSDTSQHDPAVALLEWYSAMGVDDAVETSPVGFYTVSARQREAIAAPFKKLASENVRPKTAVFSSDTAPIPADEAIEAAKRAAAAAGDFAALEKAVRAFNGCALKAGAKTTVFADGISGADLLVIGEAPGRDEDAGGKPFIGRAGQLLDKMLAAIGRSRSSNTLISNVIYWRPPGNRTPTADETAICRPFVDRLIEITEPKAIVLAGGAPTQALLGLSGIMRARGVWREIETASGARFPALPIFHPAFLLRQPGQKRLAWADLQSLAKRLSED